MYTCTSFLNFVSIKFWSWKGKWKVLLAVEQICIVAEYDFAWCLVYLLVCLTYKVRQSFGLINLSNIPKKLQTCEVWIIAGVRQSITTEAPLPLFFFFLHNQPTLGLDEWCSGEVLAISWFIHPFSLIWFDPNQGIIYFTPLLENTEVLFLLTQKDTVMNRVDLITWKLTNYVFFLFLFFWFFIFFWLLLLQEDMFLLCTPLCAC